MADVRPLPGIRYAATADLAALVTPPYDVIPPEAQTRYYERHPENIIRLELGRGEPGDDALENRYTRAAVTFAEWRLHGVMCQDAPALYLYEQRFAVAGKEHTRLSLLARVRLEPWEAQVVLPHEHTLSKPKDDRLKLLRACAANLSPIMALYEDPDKALAQVFALAQAGEPIADFVDEAGEGHRLWLLHDADVAARVATFFAARQLYIADGHHRYETALAYRDEIAEARKELPPDDAANFVLMALSAIEEPGLVVLPTHRLLRDLDAAELAAIPAFLERYFSVEQRGAMVDEQEMREWLAQADNEARFALVLPQETLLLRLRPEGLAVMAQMAGERGGASEAWQRLDVAVLHELILRKGLSVTEAAVRGGEHVSYTRDAAAAIAAVRAQGDAQAAVLLNATPPTAIRDVSRANDRMPQKSTYFYPKLITGLVINPLW